MSFFIQDLHLKLPSFLGLQHGNDPLVKAIMLLLPLVISSKYFWFLIEFILERLNENITKPWKPSIIDRSNKWC